MVKYLLLYKEIDFKKLIKSKNFFGGTHLLRESKTKCLKKVGSQYTSY